jgi:hypothetical protein
MEYEVCVNLKVVCHDGESWVYRRLTLPFPPYAGLQLWLTDDPLDWDQTLYIEETCWIVTDNEFHVCLSDFDASTLQNDTLETWTQRLKDQGWEEYETEEEAPSE